MDQQYHNRRHCQNRDQTGNRRTDIQVTVLQTIQPEEYKDITTVDLGERIYRMMAEDLGPENVSQET